MNVTFLGTSGAVPTTERNPTALLVEREGDRLLFDCGEGTQRQMMRYRTGFDIEHIFITHIHGDHVFGLPGLLQTWDFQDREKPLKIHTPSGTKRQLETLLRAAGDFPSYPVHVTAVESDTVAFDHSEYEIRTVPVNHGTRAVGYALVERERKGRFDRERAEEEFGIPPGPKYSKLHSGEPVEHDGQTVHPDDVVGPPRPGRRFVYTGDTRPVGGVVEAATDADLLVHDSTFGEEHRRRALETAHSTAREAGEVAHDAGAKRLALTHISTRYTGRGDELAAQASQRFDGRVFVADDGMQVTVPYPDSDREFRIDSDGRQ